MRKLLALAIALALASAGAADAKTFEVTKRGDPAPNGCKRNDCSLREAVQAANARPGADVIELANASKPYKLTIPGDTADDARDGDLDVTNDPLAIRHPGGGRSEIRGIALSDRLFDVFGGAPLSLKKLELTGGAVPDSNGTGGAIRASDRVAVHRSLLGGNSTEEDGGAIESTANVVITKSILRGNHAGNVGGAIDMNDEGTLRITRSAFRNNDADNTGGAIRDGSGAVTIARSKFVGNQAENDGGAIRFSSAAFRIVRSSFIGNRSTSDIGGAIQSDLEGPQVIKKSTIADNTALDDGGGIHAQGDNVLRIVSSTISGNRTEGDGGGIAMPESATASITNSTLSGNRALGFGGGILVVDDADLTLNAVTIARNHGATDDEGALAPGGGIFRNTTGTVSVRNTIIALNRIGADPVADDCAGEVGQPFDSLGNNLLSAESSVCNGFDEPGDRYRANPKLGKLKDNGGPTKTVALKRGSPAINKAHGPSSPNRDQRGVKRRNPDIGAFERE